MALHQHARHPGVDRNAGQILSGLGEDGEPVLFLVGHRAKFAQQLQAVADGFIGRGLHEGEPRNVAETQRNHLQDDARQVGAQDFRIGELRARFEVLLGVKPDGDAVGDTSTAARALVRAGLGDGLDGQPLHLRARRVARDARRARVHHVVDAWHSQGGFGDVGGQNDPAARVRAEHAVLFLVGEAAEQWGDLDAFPLLRLDGLHGVADVAFTGEETQNVPAALSHELL